MEVWKKVKGFENYEVSNFGNVRRINKHTPTRLMTPNKGKTGGYYRVNLSLKVKQKNQVKTKYVHCLVAENFIEYNYLKKGLQCNHIDGDKSNNKLDNLEIITKSENEKHAFKLGLKNLKGSKNNRAKINMDIANNIREMFKQGFIGREIAERYNVSISLVYNVKNFHRWDY